MADENKKGVVKIIPTRWRTGATDAVVEANALLSVISKNMINAQMVQDLRTGDFAVVLTFDQDISEDMIKFVNEHVNKTEVNKKISGMIDRWRKSKMN